MIALALGITALSNSVRLERLWSAPMSKAVAVSRRRKWQDRLIPFMEPGHSGVYTIDPSARAVRFLDTGQFKQFREERDVDSGVGLVSVEEASGYFATFDLASGKKLSAIAVGSGGRRVGYVLFVDLGASGLSAYDVRTGKSAPTVKQASSRFVDPIWDGRRLQLYRISSTERPSWGVFDLVKFNPGSSKPVRSAALSDMPSFDNIVGNPETGSFAIIERDGSGRFEGLTGVFTRDLKRLPLDNKIQWVSDIGPMGILAENGARKPNGEWQFTNVLCLNQNGHREWSAKCNTDSQQSAPRWIGKNVLANGVVLDGTTGRRLGTFPNWSREGESGIIAWNGDTFYRLEKHRIVAAYKIITTGG